jgi:2-desacetyl-2-hydroxyethyl bacteriochlorophyllide A dehydrogenase
VLLKTLYSGISNGTERNQILGNNYNSGRRYPFGLGYQSVSEVVEVGREITRFAPGDRVITGVSQTHVEYYLVRETDLICKLPSDFDLEAGALLSVAAVALHDVRRAEVTQSDKVLVCGGGVLGNCAMQHARQTGAQTWLLNRSEPRARMADQLGATGIIWGDMDAIQTGLTELKPFDVVIETTGNDDLLQLLVGQGWGQGVFRSRGRGRLVMIGGKFDICYNSNAAQSAELSILHAAHYVQDDLDETASAARPGCCPPPRGPCHLSNPCPLPWAAAGHCHPMAVSKQLTKTPPSLTNCSIYACFR